MSDIEKINGTHGFSSPSEPLRVSKAKLDPQDLASFNSWISREQALKVGFDAFCKQMEVKYGFVGRKWTIDPDDGTIQLR